MTGVVGFEALALAGESDADAGPAILYLSGDTALEPEPIGWPARATRGLLVRQFDRAVPDDERQLSALRAEDGLGEEAAPLRTRHITRLVAWRTPGAPLSLAIRLRTQPAAISGRLVDGARSGQSLALCPASLDPVEPLHTSRESHGSSK